MIAEQYVSFEIAKLLKEKRFPQAPNNINFNVYVIRDIDDPDKGKWGAGYMFFGNNSYATCLDKNSLAIAPSQSVVMRWLREAHNIDIIVFHEMLPKNCYWAIIEKYQYTEFQQEPVYLTYEQACEAAIKYCLENLI